MNEWHPSKDEVARILDEMRPIIAEMSRREEAALRAVRPRLDELFGEVAAR